MQNNDPNTPTGGDGRPQQSWPGPGGQPPYGRPPQGPPPQGPPPQGPPPQGPPPQGPPPQGRPPQGPPPQGPPPQGPPPQGPPPQGPPQGQPTPAPQGPNTPVPQAPPGYAQQPQQYGQQSQQAPQQRESTRDESVRPSGAADSEKKSSKLGTIAVIVAALAALAAIVYGAYAGVMRRGVFSDIAEDSGSVSKDDASGSDKLDMYMMYGALALVVIAVLLWLAAAVSARRGRSGLGYAGLGLLVVGAIGGGVGAYLTSSDEVDTIANGYLAVGAGFVVMGVGLLLGAVALRQPGTTPDDEPSSRYQPNPYVQQSQQQYGQRSDRDNPYGGQGR